MKNIDSYSSDSFEFYKRVVKRKQNSPQDPTYKDRIDVLESNIETLFSTHTTEFEANNLNALNPHGYVNQEKDDLTKLYSYQLKQIQQLKIQLTSRDNNIEDPICPYCTINDVGSMDHILPVSDFPEFSVNPRNLFPMCTGCNSTKSTVRGTASNLFLNLYLDLLPDIQFLFATIDASLKVSFTVDNRNGIDPILFSTIQSHYSRLDLCNRFSKRSIRVIDRLKSSVSPHLKRGMDISLVRQDTTQAANDIRGICGFNFWESILEIELINSQYFIDECLR